MKPSPCTCCDCEEFMGHCQGHMIRSLRDDVEHERWKLNELNKLNSELLKALKLSLGGISVECAVTREIVKDAIAKAEQQ